MSDVAQVLADRRAEVEAEIAHLQRPTDESGGISFGKRVGDGTSIAVERLSQVAASDRLQALLADVMRAQQKLSEGTYGGVRDVRPTDPGRAPGGPALGCAVHHLPRRRPVALRPPASPKQCGVAPEEEGNAALLPRRTGGVMRRSVCSSCRRATFTGRCKRSSHLCERPIFPA